MVVSMKWSSHEEVRIDVWKARESLNVNAFYTCELPRVVLNGGRRGETPCVAINRLLLLSFIDLFVTNMKKLVFFCFFKALVNVISKVSVTGPYSLHRIWAPLWWILGSELHGMAPHSRVDCMLNWLKDSRAVHPPFSLEWCPGHVIYVVFQSKFTSFF